MNAFKRTLVGLAVAAAIGAGAAQAQISDNVIKIGVLSDMSSLYTDLAGAGSVVAAQMAVEDSGIEKRGVKVEFLSADHQNKPDVGSGVARQWYDVDKVDVIVDVPNSGVALAVNQITREKGKAFLVSGAASSDLTGKACSPNTIHWTYDTWMLANGTGSAIVKTGGDTWFFLTADYAFGHALERDTEAVVLKTGGKVLGKVRAPAQHAGLLVVPAAGAGVQGQDRRSRECRRRHDQLDQAGGRIRHRQGRAESGRAAGVHHRHPRARPADRAGPGRDQHVLLGHERPDARVRQALRGARQGHPPTMIHAGVYSAVTHYLKAVEALKSDDGTKVIAKMKETPTDDPLFGKGSIRADGRKIHPAYLVEVKKPSESKGPWDYYKVRATIPADQAFRPLERTASARW